MFRTVDAAKCRQRLFAQGARLGRRGFPVEHVGQPPHRLLRNRIDWTVGGGTERRNLVLVSDVVQGILLAESAGRAGRGYILGGEEWAPRDVNRVSLEEAGKKPRLRVSVPLPLARTAARVADRIRGFPRAVGYEQAVETLAREWCCSSQRAENELGYRRTPVREGIRRTLDFLKAGEDHGE